MHLNGNWLKYLVWPNWDEIAITICSIVFDPKKRSIITIMTHILRRNYIQALTWNFSQILCEKQRSDSAFLAEKKENELKQTKQTTKRLIKFRLSFSFSLYFFLSFFLCRFLSSFFYIMYRFMLMDVSYLLKYDFSMQMYESSFHICNAQKEYAHLFFFWSGRIKSLIISSKRETKNTRTTVSIFFFQIIFSWIKFRL